MRKLRRLLVIGEPNDQHAYVGINRGPDAFGLYAVGYFEGAGQLARNMLTPGGMADLVVYSALFLLRHGVELSLKQLARYHEDVAPMGTAQPHGHSVKQIWLGRSKTGAMSENGGVRSLIEYSVNQGRFFELPHGAILSVEDMDDVIADLDTLDGCGSRPDHRRRFEPGAARLTLV